MISVGQVAVSLLSIHWAEIKVWLGLHLSSGPLYLLLSSFWRSSFVSGHIREGVLLGPILDFFFFKVNQINWMWEADRGEDRVAKYQESV